jgi:AcrR family transcriptional regulator
MGAKERREREKAANRQRILDTARDLLVDEGYEGVTMRRLAERIEYSPTAIYQHFADKQALLTELSVCDFKAFTDRFELVPRDLPPLAKLTALGRAYVRFAQEHPAQYRHLFMTKREISDEAHAAKPDEDAYTLLCGAVDAAIATGDIHPGWASKRDFVAQTLWASLHGVVALAMTMPKKNSDIPDVGVEPLAEIAMQVLVAGLQAPPAP